MYPFDPNHHLMYPLAPNHHQILARDDGWKDVMAQVTNAGYASVLSAPYYLNKVINGSKCNN
jgi:hypothetical protein